MEVELLVSLGIANITLSATAFFTLFYKLGRVERDVHYIKRDVNELMRRE